MAGASNAIKSTMKTKQFSYDIFFDGALLSSTRGSLVVELIKYFLYERQQIPLSVDELKHQVTHEENTNLNVNVAVDHHHPSVRKTQNLHDHDTNKLALKFNSLHFNKPGAHSDVPLTDVTNFDTSHNSSQQCDSNYSNDHKVISTEGSSTSDGRLMATKLPLPKVRTQDKKAKHLVTELTHLFDNLQKAFELCPEIEQVAIILGGTVMNPKESYVISFPPPCPDADSITLKSCKRTLFQQIIGEDILGTMNTSMSPTNMMLLILAPRSCPLKGFVPKHFMRSPKTGAVISFNFHCNYLLPVCHDLTFVEDFEMSGIELLDIMQKGGDSGESRLSVCAEFGAHSTKEVCTGSGLSSSEITSDGEHVLHSGCEIRHVPGHKQTPSIKLFNKILASPVVRSIDVPTNGDPNHMNSDCIWYQSPIVIKGYRIKDVFHSAFTCS